MEFENETKHKKYISILLGTKKVGGRNMTKPMKQIPPIYDVTIDEVYGVVLAALEEYAGRKK